MHGKKDIFINKLCTFLAESYQFLGRLEWDYGQYKDEIVPFMDIICELLSESDEYFTDRDWDNSQEWLEERLKFFKEEFQKTK